MKLLNKILLPLVCAMLLSACSAVVDGSEDAVPASRNNFINLAITVVNGNGEMTRAVPAGGENGEGREAGFNRENTVTGITLILYKGTGINGAATTPIDFVAYYPTTRSTTDPAGTQYGNTKTPEATYTTGNQIVPHNSLDFTKTYHAIVVANADLTGTITTSSTLSDVRNLTLSNIYSGDPTKPAQQCGAFVMSSEQDNTLDFAASGVRTQDAAGDYFYDMTSQTLVIERMAARIDFWAVNGTYNSEKHGYVYNVGETADRFVMTGIMPFNLTNNHTTYGEEYLLKRLTASLSTITPQWLVDETTTNYVLDPKTTAKVTAEHPKLTNSLEDIKDLTAEQFVVQDYYKSIQGMHEAVQATGSNAGYASLTDLSMTGEDIVVAYPMENTLLPESKLYYHATGIAIEGYYYRGGLTGNATRRVYYGYLRHQGDGASYDIETTNSTTELSSSTTAMNIGIVRNNIYRVWIGSITPDIVAPKVTLKIKVKKWDQFTHETIYM